MTDERERSKALKQLQREGQFMDQAIAEEKSLLQKALSDKAALQEENARLRDVIDGITSDLEKIIRRDKFSKSAPRPLTAEEIRDKAVKECHRRRDELWSVSRSPLTDEEKFNEAGSFALDAIATRIAALSTMKEDGDG